VEAVQNGVTNQERPEKGCDGRWPHWLLRPARILSPKLEQEA